MSAFLLVTGARVLVVLGVINLLALLLLFVSCRCMMGSKLGGKLGKYKPYQRLAKNHCQIWKILWPSVAVHAFLGIMVLGWPG